MTELESDDVFVGPRRPVTTVDPEGLLDPEGMGLSAEGDLFIADAGNSRVVMLPGNGGAQTTVGSGFDHPSGVAVYAPPPTFTAASPPRGLLPGVPYSYQFEAATPAGQPAPRFLYHGQGVRPPGLSLDPVTGVLQGTPTPDSELNGIGHGWEFQVQVGNMATASVTTVHLSMYAAVFTAEDPPDHATLGVPYSYTFKADGVAGTTFEPGDTGALPDGLTLHSDGVLSGTPTKPGYYMFTVKAVNSFGWRGTDLLHIEVPEPPPPPTVTIATPTDGAVYPADAVPDLDFTCTAADDYYLLPDLQGCFAQIDGGDKVASGAALPDTAGPHTVVVTAVHFNGQDASETRSYSVTALPPPTATITTPADGATYSAGSVPNAEFSCAPGAGGQLLLGLDGCSASIDSGAPLASGAPLPQSPGPHSITVTAKDIDGQQVTVTHDFTVRALAITSAASTTFTTGVNGSFTIAAEGTPAAAITATGDLPEGVTLTDNGDGTADLSGTPAANSGGKYELTLTARNGVAPDVTQSFVLTVEEAAAITSADHTTFKAGAADTFTVTTEAGFPTATVLKVAGALPAGVSFVDGKDGTATLSGTPEAGTGGEYPLTITADNGVTPAGTQAFTLVVTEPPSITSADHADLTVGSAGTFTVTTTAGHPADPDLSVTGPLPDGVTFADNGDGTGTLAGTPLPGSGGTYALTVSADNGAGPAATQDLVLTVLEAPAITSPGSAAFDVAVAGSVKVTALGYPDPALTVTGTLPNGVTFKDKGDGTATLAGTPTAAGVYEIVIHAANGVAPDAAQTFRLVVSAVHAGGGDPTITAALSSDVEPTSSGWYRDEVTVTFTCTTHGAPLVEPCPAAVTLGEDGAGQAVSRTIRATNGGAASVSVSGINIDRTAPRLRVGRVRDGAVYRGIARRPRCVAHDATSGVKNCRLHRSKRGSRVTIVATARDAAGNVSRARVRYHVLRFFVRGARFKHGRFVVRPGRAYRLVALTKGHRPPRYFHAVRAGHRPHHAGPRMNAAGRTHGWRRWRLTVVVLPKTGHTVRGKWVLGVRTGKVMHRVRVRPPR